MTCSLLNCDKHVARRIGLAAGIVRNLHKIWKAGNKSRPIIVPNSGPDNNTLWASLIQKLGHSRVTKKKVKSFWDVSVEKDLRCSLTRRDRRRNLDIGLLKELDIQSTKTLCKSRRHADWRIFRPCDPHGGMGSDRYPHLLLHGYTHGHRPKGRPRNKWLDNIRDDCKEMSVTI